MIGIPTYSIAMPIWSTSRRMSFNLQKQSVKKVVMIESHYSDRLYHS